MSTNGKRKCLMRAIKLFARNFFSRKIILRRICNQTLIHTSLRSILIQDIRVPLNVITEIVFQLNGEKKNNKLLNILQLSCTKLYLVPAKRFSAPLINYLTSDFIFQSTLKQMPNTQNEQKAGRVPLLFPVYSPKCMNRLATAYFNSN